MNVNVPSEVTRPDGERGAVTIRLMGGRGVSGRSGDEKVTPPSLPASQGARSNRRSLAHSPFWNRGIPDTPTNQSGLGAIIVTSVTRGCVWLISKSTKALPGDEPMLPPVRRRSAVPGRDRRVDFVGQPRGESALGHVDDAVAGCPTFTPEIDLRRVRRSDERREVG